MLLEIIRAFTSYSIGSDKLSDVYQSKYLHDLDSKIQLIDVRSVLLVYQIRYHIITVLFQVSEAF